MDHDPRDNASESSAIPVDNRRAGGRLPQELLACNLGPVLDLSSGGMRILTRSVPKGRIDIELISPDIRIRLVGEICWTKRRGIFKREVGIRFVGLDPALSQILTRLSLISRMRRTMINDQAA